MNSVIYDYKEFCAARKEFREWTAGLPKKYPFLDFLRGEGYVVQRAVVYNESLDEIDGASDIRLILVGDNPGRREQETGRYLVGQSGKLAENFFCAHPALGIDFRRNVIILNKTPLHTPRTAGLKTFAKACGAAPEEAAALLQESQVMMAHLLRRFYKALLPAAVWVIGYSELKKGGLFETYARALFDAVPADALRLFRHFSMNQFSIDYNKKKAETQLDLLPLLDVIGCAHRDRVRAGLLGIA